MTHEEFRLGVLCAAAIVQTTFVLVYATRPWWRAFTGRALFVKSAALMLLVDLGVLNRFADYSGKRSLEDAVWLLVLLGMVWQLIALAHGPRIDRR